MLALQSEYRVRADSRSSGTRFSFAFESHQKRVATFLPFSHLTSFLASNCVRRSRQRQHRADRSLAGYRARRENEIFAIEQIRAPSRTGCGRACAKVHVISAHSQLLETYCFLV